MKLDDKVLDDLEIEDIETVKKRAERRKKRKKKGFSPVILLIAVLLIVLAVIISVGFASTAFESLMGFEVDSDLSSIFLDLDDNEAGIIYNDAYDLENKAYLESGKLYLPYDYVTERLNDWFYHDENEGLVLYTTPEGTETVEEGDDAKEIDGVFCLSLALIKKYTDIDIKTYEKEKVPYIYIRNSYGSYKSASVKKKTPLHLAPEKKSGILSAIEADKNVRILDAGTEWTEVQTEEGKTGFVENDHLGEYSDMTDSAPGNVPEMVFPSSSFNEKVSLGWHQVMNADANEGVYGILENDSAVNVLGPTWCSLSDTEGNLRDISSSSYVEAAHSAGKKVWVVVDNFNDREFPSESGTYEVLSRTSKRKKLIDNIISIVLSNGADGINIDFEGISVETGVHFSQFVKELSLAAHDNSLILSVDNYVPSNYTRHYDRKVQGQVCDFVVIMGYDEYNAGSDEAGPVASLDFVQNGIENTLMDVDASKVINGIPFYSRLWETDKGVVKSVQALGMTEAAEALKKRGVTASWDDGAGMNYGEYEEDGSLWRMWIEDNESVTARLSIMKNNNLAGVAFWKLGLEDSSVWSVISGYLAG